MEFEILNDQIERLENLEQDRLHEEKRLDELEILKIRSEKLKDLANERLTNTLSTTPARGSDLLINQPQIISWRKNKEFDKHKLI